MPNSNQNFVTDINGFDIFLTTENTFVAVKKDSKITRKVIAQIEDSTLISIAQKCLSGQKFAVVQLQRICQAVLNFCPQEFGKFYQIAR